MNEQKQESAAMDTLTTEAAPSSGAETTGTRSAAPSSGMDAGGWDSATAAGMEEDVLFPDGWTGTELFPVTEEDPLGMGPAPDTAADAGKDAGKDAAVEGNGPEARPEDAPETATGLQTASDRQTASVRQTPEQTETPAGEEEQDGETEPDYKALWLAHQEERNAAHFRQVYQAQKEAGMTDEAARMIAANECGGRTYPLDSTANGNGGTAEAGQDSGIDAQLRRLHSIVPEAREIPRAVMKRVRNGENLVDAYLSNALSERDAAIAAQKREIAMLRQNASNREKAVASGVSGQGMKSEAPDEFLQGFLSEDY